MRPTSQKEQTPKKAGRGKKTKVVEEIIPGKVPIFYEYWRKLFSNCKRRFLQIIN